MQDEKQFNELTPDMQWLWLISLTKESKNEIQITIDNDNTTIWIEKHQQMLSFKEDLGYRSGVKILLTVMGFNVDYA